MATSLLRMGRICCCLKPFQVNLCTRWRTIPAVAYSSKFGDQKMAPRKTHIKKAKPKPKLDIAQLLISLGMNPPAQPSSATNSAAPDALRHTKPTARAGPLVSASSPPPMPATPPPPHERPTTAVAPPPPGSPTTPVDSAAPLVTATLQTEPRTSPPPSASSSQTEPNTSLTPSTATMQTEPKTSPALEFTTEAFSARVVAPSNPVDQTDAESAASGEFASQGSAAAPGLTELEAVTPSGSPPVPRPASAMDSSASSEPTLVSAVDSSSLSEPTPVFAVDPSSLSAVDSTAPSEPPPASSVDSSALSEPHPVSAVDSHVLSGSLPVDSFKTSASPGLTETVMEEVVSGISPGLTANPEVISHESKAHPVDPVSAVPTLELSAAEAPLALEISDQHGTDAPSATPATSDSSGLELSTGRGSTAVASSEPAVTTSEASSLEADAITASPVQDARVELPITAAAEQDGAVSTMTTSAPLAEAESTREISATATAPPAEAETSMEISATTPSAEAESTMATSATAPPAEAESTMEMSAAAPLAEAESTMEMSAAAPLAEAESTMEMSATAPSAEAETSIEMSATMGTSGIATSAESLQESSVLLGDLLSEEAAALLEDVAVPDLINQVEALSLHEVSSFLETVPTPKATAEDVSPASSVDVMPLELPSELEIAPFLESSSVPDLTSHVEAISLLEVASFLETVPEPPAATASDASAEPLASLEDVTVPDLMASIESVSLLEVGAFLEDISVPEEAISTPGVSSLQADTSDPSPAVDNISLLEVTPGLEDASVPDLTPHLEAVSLLEVAQFLETVPNTDATAEIRENESPGVSAGGDITSPTAGPPLDSDSTPAAAVTSSGLLDAVWEDYVATEMPDTITDESAATQTADSITDATQTLDGITDESAAIQTPGDITYKSAATPMLDGITDETASPQMADGITDATLMLDSTRDESAPEPLPEPAHSLTQPAPLTDSPMETQDALGHVQTEAPREELTHTGAATEELTPTDAPTEELVLTEAATEELVLTEAATEELVLTEAATEELVLTEAATEELAQESAEAHLDPVQRLFLEKIREYQTLSQSAGGVPEAGSDGSEFQRRLAEEEAKLQRLYGGRDLTEFPEFNFPEPRLDEASTK